MVKPQISSLLPLSLLILLLVSGRDCAAATALTSTPDQLPAVVAMLDAYGGIEALAGVRTVTARGRIDDHLRHVSGGYSRIMRRPGSLRIEIRPEQGGEIRVLAGNQGWQGAGDHFYPAKPLSLSSMHYQYSYLDVPMCLADQSCKATDGGKINLDGKLYDLLLIATAGAPELRVYLDRKSHLIHRVAADFNMGPLGTSELATEYSDYRPVSGLLFPRLLTNFAGGGKISLLTIETLEINTPLPAEVFTPPVPLTAQ